MASELSVAEDGVDKPLHLCHLKLHGREHTFVTESGTMTGVLTLTLVSPRGSMSPTEKRCGR